MLAKDGVPKRAFAYGDGEVLVDEGEPTAVETALAWYPLRLDETSDEDDEEDDRPYGPDEDDVMSVAGAWSINPQLLGASLHGTGTGVLATAPVRGRTARAPVVAASRRPWWRFWG